MFKRTGTLAVVCAVMVGAAAASALYAQDDHRPSDSTRGHEPTNRGAMMGMMTMMPQMSQMMDHCATMMSGAGRPNDRWRKPGSATPNESR